MHLQQSQCMHSSFPSTSVDSSYIRKIVLCAGWSFDDEGVVNSSVYPQIPSSVARASGVASFKNCFMLDRNGPKYSTFRLIQGVGSSTIFTFLFLSSSSSFPVTLVGAEPLWLVLLPDACLETAMRAIYLFSLSRERFSSIARARGVSKTTHRAERREAGGPLEFAFFFYSHPPPTSLLQRERETHTNLPNTYTKTQIERSKIKKKRANFMFPLLLLLLLLRDDRSAAP